jgi:thymidylate synthase (FAD)
MVELKFHCCMPIFVARQWIRHRTANVNEYSGRYSLMPMLFYTPAQEQFQKQSQGNHQGRSEQCLQGPLYDEAVVRLRDIRERAQTNYEWMNEQDVARELARIDLPLSTYTQWYWKIDLHNLLHFLTLRVDTHAQWEIQEFGRVIAGIMRRVVPLSYEAWIDYQVCGARMSRMELEAVRALVEVGDDGSVRARPGASLDRDRMLALGFGTREVGEFCEKLRPADVPSFEVSYEQSQPAEHFEARAAAAVPSVTRAGAGKD